MGGISPGLCIRTELLGPGPDLSVAHIHFPILLSHSSLVRSIDRSLALTPRRHLLASLKINILVNDVELFTIKAERARFCISKNWSNYSTGRTL
jgi:hypothetical protein